MCKPASFVVTRKQVFWSEKTESHDKIIEEFNLHEGDANRGVNFVRTEISPPGNDLTLPLRAWEYHLDQDVLPEWHDPEETEARCRYALKEWATRKLILDGHGDYGNERQVYACGHASISLFDRATAALFQSSTATLYDNSQVVLNDHSRARLWMSSAAWLHDRSSAVAHEDASVSLYDMSRAELKDGARATAFAYGRVKLFEHSFALLFEYSHAELHDTSHARLTRHSHANACLYGQSFARLEGNNYVELFEHSQAVVNTCSTFAVYDDAVAIHRRDDEPVQVDGNFRHPAFETDPTPS